MADTKHVHVAAPVEGDGLSYSGLVWFVVILVGTTVFCQVLVWGGFKVMEYRAERSDATRAPLAAAPANPSIQDGHVVTGTEAAPQPGLLVVEPTVLGSFRKQEDDSLSTYGWVDQPGGAVRIPIDRAKELIIQRGLPTRPGAPASSLAATTAAPAPTPAPAPVAATEKPGGGH